MYRVIKYNFGDKLVKKILVVVGMCLIGMCFYIGGSGLMASGRGKTVRQAAKKEGPASDMGYSKKQADKTLCNPNADENARRLMSYLADTYGKQFLSGQYCDDKYNRSELHAVQSVTGKEPAIAGFDFIRYSASMINLGETSSATQWALEEAKDGAIITFCWHWNPSEAYLTRDVYNGSRKENTTIDLDRIMRGEDEAGYNSLLADMDTIAYQLKLLEQEGVPVIWRPLHEAGKKWFWWGNCESESYKQLYRLMFQRFTYTWELNNLIWMWNGEDKEWYPGDDVVDMIGEDIYSDPYNYDPHAGQFEKAVRDYTQAGKMAALSEAVPLFDPVQAVKQGAMWSFFCQWGGSSVCRDIDSGEYTEEHMSREMLKEIYNSDYVITRDELPDLKQYPVE